jgi:hypothetical protein
MTYTIAEYTVNTLLMMYRRSARNYVEFHDKNIMKLVRLVGFITKKFVTMHGHMNKKKVYT